MTEHDDSDMYKPFTRTIKYSVLYNPKINQIMIIADSEYCFYFDAWLNKLQDYPVLLTRRQFGKRRRTYNNWYLIGDMD